MRNYGHGQRFWTLENRGLIVNSLGLPLHWLQVFSKKCGIVMKNYLVTHSLKSDEAMDAFYGALEAMSEADIRGAMKDESASFQVQWNARKLDKVFSVGGRPRARKQLSRPWVTWRNYLIRTFERCQAYLIFQTDAKVRGSRETVQKRLTHS